MKWDKKHNTATGPKTEIREHILEHIGVDLARVLDCYCGPVGEMFDRVWHRASSYTGIDKEWRGLELDRRRRFVGDTLTLLRAIDLSKYNIFDVDCFGCPWSTMLMIQRHRTWAPGELGAVVITDGAFVKAALGGITHAHAQALGKSTRPSVATRATYDDARSMALERWLERSNLVARAGWQASVNRQAHMYYGGIVFESRA